MSTTASGKANRRDKTPSWPAWLSPWSRSEYHHRPIDRYQYSWLKKYISYWPAALLYAWGAGHLILPVCIGFLYIRCFQWVPWAAMLVFSSRKVHMILTLYSEKKARPGHLKIKSQTSHLIRPTSIIKLNYKTTFQKWVSYENSFRTDQPGNNTQLSKWHRQRMTTITRVVNTYK